MTKLALELVRSHIHKLYISSQTFYRKAGGAISKRRTFDIKYRCIRPIKISPFIDLFWTFNFFMIYATRQKVAKYYVQSTDFFLVLEDAQNSNYLTYEVAFWKKTQLLQTYKA